uniref:Uncharacterized protein n=1 Tax=Panagrellus redivivus TaxID=6233 RepID=A0A7E4VDQ5_PANRE
MYHLFAFVLLMVTIQDSLTLVMLGVGDEVTVTFTGNLLRLHVLNPKRRHRERFTVCFKSHPNNIAEYCPRGYATLYYWSWENLPASQYRINRRGKLDGSTDEIEGDVVFNDDGSVTLRVQELPYGCSVKLLNAEKVIPTTTTEKPTTTVTVPEVKTLNNTVYYVIGGLAVLLVVIVGTAAIWICYSRKSKPEKEVKGGLVPANGSDDNNISRLTSTSPPRTSNNLKRATTIKKIPRSSRSIVKKSSQNCAKPKSSVVQPLSIHLSSNYGNNTASAK